MTYTTAHPLLLIGLPWLGCLCLTFVADRWRRMAKSSGRAAENYHIACEQWRSEAKKFQ